MGRVSYLAQNELSTPEDRQRNVYAHIDERAEVLDGPDTHERRDSEEGPGADRAAVPRVCKICELDDRPGGQPVDAVPEPGADHGVDPDPPAIARGPHGRADIDPDRGHELALANTNEGEISTERRIPVRIDVAPCAGRP